MAPTHTLRSAAQARACAHCHVLLAHVGIGTCGLVVVIGSRKKENPNALLDVVITRWWSWSWTPEVVVVGERREARHEAHPGARHDRHPCVRGVPTKYERRPSGGAEHHRRGMHAPSAIGIFHLPESRSSAGETATSHVQRLVGRIERD
jgi:hypothetical protein